MNDRPDENSWIYPTILRVLQGRATPEEAAEVRAWRLADPRHEAIHDELRVRPEMLRYFHEEVEPGPAPDAADLMRRAETRPRERASAARSVQRRWGFYGLAAAAVLAIAVGLDAFRSGPGSTPAYGAEELVTGEAETVTVTLRDGTIVRLAPRSRLRVAPEPERREVTLSGRAYFVVAHRPDRPFRVHTTAGDVRVLGTRFDLQTDDRELRVVVAEGRVAVSSAEGDLELQGGQMSGVRDGRSLPVIPVANARQLSSWMGSFLAFQDTPLGQAAREIEAVYGIRVRFAEPELADRVITAWFVDRTVEEVVQVVCLAAITGCALENGELVMSATAVTNGR